MIEKFGKSSVEQPKSILKKTNPEGMKGV